LPRFGIEVSLVEATKTEEIAAAVRPNTKLLFVETPTNPLLKVVDLVQVAKLGQEKDIPVMVDSTFATPINLRPLELGANVVLHSATKYLGGHHDLTAGVICGSKEFIQEARTLRKSLGGTLDPWVAWLLSRSLQTLELRMGRHNANGMEVAKYLAGHPRVKQVYYPGLPSHLQHSLAKQQMQGFGGVVSFEIDSVFESITAFAESLKLFRLAPSLGGTESLVTQPVTSSHYFVSVEERIKAGITDQLVRLAVGVENSKAIIADLEQAFDKLN
jgi:cystathionine beta-lyase/cystathionine gamma-synthase